MVCLSVSLLGSFHTTLDGVPITGFRSDKARALLAYLVMEAGREHSRPNLAGLFWPDFAECVALSNLRRELSGLRHIIGDHYAATPFLRVTREAIQFNLAGDYWLDVAEFCARVQYRPESQLIEQELEDAIRLYRGSFMEGFALKDSPGFDDWCLLTRERLLGQVVEACGRLAGFYERKDNLARAREITRRAIELEPSNEEAHRQLMRLLALSGQRSDALRQYEVCRRVLAEELEVEPADETTELYLAIRSGSATLNQRRFAMHNLPILVQPLVGREVELAHITDHLDGGTCRLLTLLGPGGCGKTRLALEAAIELVDRFSDGVFLVSLTPVRSASAMVGAIAQAVGLTSPGNNDPKPDARRQLFDYLRRKRMLLVLDSFEHLLGGDCPEGHASDAGGLAARTLPAQILAAAPKVTLLVTSRVRLNLADEHLLPISGLEYPRPCRAATLSGGVPSWERVGGQSAGAPEGLVRYGAVALFLRATLRARPGFVPKPDDLPDIARVCQIVQGMPLPLLLAASWTSILTPAEIAEQLAEHSLDFLDAGESDLPERQCSMRATFDYSWRMLGERERTILAGLSVFRGGCTTQAAAHVAGATLRDLRALADRSLLQRGQAGRWEMHDLLREYAAEQLAHMPGGGAAIRDRHAAYYAATAEAMRDDLHGLREGKVSAEMAPDAANYQTAWGWAIQRGSVEWLGRMLDGLCDFCERSARFQEGATACQTAAEALAGQPGGEQVLARVLTWLGFFDWMLGRMEPASTVLWQCLALLGKLRQAGLDVRSEEAAALLGLARLLHYTDSRTRCRELCEQSLALYRALDDRRGMAQALCWSGISALGAGHHRAARELLEESLAIQRALGDQTEVTNALKFLVQVDCHEGKLEQAEALAQQCVVIARAAQNLTAVADALLTLACVQAYQGAFSAAHELLVEVIALCDDIGAQDLSCVAQDVRTWMKMNLGDYGAALPVKQANLARFRQIGDAAGIGIELLGTGEIAMAEGRLTDAVALISESADLMGKIGQRIEQGLALAHLAQSTSLRGHPIQARSYLRQALQAASETHNFAAGLSSIVAAAVCLAGEGQAERAVELYSLATRYPYVGNSRFREDVAGKHIVALVGSLSPETIAAAQARGRARELRSTLAELVDEFGQADRVERSTAPCG